jgi:hypothetical protein
LVRLSNRIDAEEQNRIVGSLDVRIPIQTTAELRALQLENAQADAGFWKSA